MNTTDNTLLQIFSPMARPAGGKALGAPPDRQTPSTFQRLVEEKRQETGGAPKEEDGSRDITASQPASEDEPVTSAQQLLASAMAAQAAASLVIQPEIGTALPAELTVETAALTADQTGPALNAKNPALLQDGTGQAAPFTAAEPRQTTKVPETGRTVETQTAQTPARSTASRTAETELPSLDSQRTARETAEPRILKAETAANPQTDAESVTTTKDGGSVEPETGNGGRQTADGDPSKGEGGGANAVEHPVFRDPRAVHIKVGETLDTRAPDMTEKLADRVRETLIRGESRVELQLTPGNLGTLTVEITRGQDGALHVVLSAASERAQTLLERQSGGLQALLMNSSGSVQVEVQRQQDGQPAQQHPYDQQQGHQSQQQSQQQQQQRQRSDDFLQQLRLGLFPSDEAVS